MTANQSLKNVEKFKYLGTRASNQSCIQEESNSKLNPGNAC
jgi:hypothetical protein